MTRFEPKTENIFHYLLAHHKKKATHSFRIQEYLYRRNYFTGLKEKHGDGGRVEVNVPSDYTQQSYQEEYKRLLDEFDEYKRRQKDQRVSKDSTNEVVEYKQKLCRLERERDRLKMRHEDEERANLQVKI